MAVNERDPVTGHKLTGHEWNGIIELNTRVPLLVWLFLAGTVIFAIGYWILMPTWPIGRTYTHGLLKYDQHKEIAEQLVKAADERSHWTNRVMALDYAQIKADPALLEKVREDGHRLFGDNCAACHGSNATGSPGFPDLVDKDWLWGGSTDAIATTIAEGVNSPASADTRVSQMPAFGKDEMLDNASIVAVANYVKSLSDPAWAKGKAATIATGRQVFADNCASCHGDDAHGSQDLGAPNLTDKTWLFGGDYNTIHETIYNGRHSEMPAWKDRLSPLERKILEVYVLDKGNAL